MSCLLKAVALLGKFVALAGCAPAQCAIINLQDMTTDGGGWTLVFHENQPRSCQIDNNNANAQARCGMASSPILASGTVGSAKYADVVINALKTDASSRQRYESSLLCAQPRHARALRVRWSSARARACIRVLVQMASVCGCVTRVCEIFLM